MILLDKRLRKYLNKIVKEMKREGNTRIISIGEQRMGMSVIGMQIGEYLKKKIEDVK